MLNELYLKYLQKILLKRGVYFDMCNSLHKFIIGFRSKSQSSITNFHKDDLITFFKGVYEL